MKILLRKDLRGGTAGLAASVRRLLPGAAVAAGRGCLRVSAASTAPFAEAAPAIENLPGVASVSLSTPELCPLACAGKRKPFSSPLDFARGPVFIAGPCAVEDEASYVATALALKAAGAHALRAAIFKPRSSPYAYQGLGWKGLKTVLKAKKLTGLPLVTEATDTRQVGRLAEACDVLQVGARNMRNYELLKELARSGRPVLLKRSPHAGLTEWLLSVEYLLAHGARGIVLCERGGSPCGPRQDLDLNLLASARSLTGLPAIADPSHAARDRSHAAALAGKALGAGADGLLVEVSLDPLAARVDGRHTLTVDAFRGITGE
ncbi:MAG: 3-deoxy-7-phosphoheptulonate synthase [Elusimicrobia bacterium]|nr:3-deoxy-7-phosphoheptulonate synthase [Elusimicrobiota bacterium]